MNTPEGAEPFDFDGDYGGDYEYIARTVIPGYRSSFRQALALLAGRVGPSPRVLVVGAGTGIELVTFKTAEPGWRLTGVDPSRQMIEIARRRMREAGVGDGARLVHGHVSDLDEDGFAAATCFNVMHFLPDDGAKQSLLHDIARRLAPGAPFLLFELHGDRSSPRFDELFAAWSRYWKIHGMGEAERAAFRARIDEGIHWASEARILQLLAEAGFEDAWRYYRALLYGGWISRRALQPLRSSSGK
ncbi:class I SAM-dependent methyltransferase [Candidatus Palauibacter polyketidifaciens]|uniref:class I SAM-dependent methyltransferase n=1 Tax=Candidatus Palauibacter polyketidifaciens TaxID=3056740 RepID=UPI0023A1469B|nr:class I SAM-dependent methyltransferase [Candidatus Palauibacter polyketidifaciens]MDE2719769.1 class I SAM-dependent methyltransferase [Candidatus Palauibacter polyketidifaciens]